jgi:hypothetical protein
VIQEVIQETFVEWEWDDKSQAQQERDRRQAELRLQGYECSSTHLYRITDGQSVFLLVARPLVPKTRGSARLEGSTSSPPARRSTVASQGYERR